ncbi:stage III sporulation protein AA [Brevibacillus sp. TJ4]|uniref:stage III sporulation protein AA n=1 Tax=Brevibacillus sp. TJ4 TaxID=3234853 RepID=UPI0037D48CF2
MKEIVALLPASVRSIVAALPSTVAEQLEEIRLRQNQPMEIRYGHQTSYVTASGHLTSIASNGWIFTAEQALKLVNQISQHSLYALEEELRRGYITVVGGHRIGIAGKVVLDRGEVKGIRDVTSFNIRIAREKKGVAHAVMPYLFAGGKLLNTLVISPPQCGKTTLLRDMARTISYGSEWASSRKVGIVDERSELAGCLQGVPQRDVGPRTDVLDACPKAVGMMMLIRSMSPDVLIVDEIGRPEDGDAVWEAIHAGVAVICSAHGAEVSEVAQRPMLGKLIRHGAFARYIVLSRANGVGTIQAVYDQSLQPLTKERATCSS